ncbi:tRNA(His) 5'-end guanylyltransferase [Methanobrevibacter olleyae]|uniref:tRNA(His) guanylyltransferase n=2 Tax=Methanobrevibacter olleyae TaxID=294671 RepID=A0A126QXX2_METOL|nr:tRNA(His) guanylyltransferase ThgL [Methanobrevibacter olleyae]SFL44635.1 tRNA(His) 5'-end guanylyltransferase [Methanobrevibacter olleyae]
MNLGDLMKDYEIYSTMKVPKNSKIILRLDGRKFHSLARALKLSKPYDDRFYKIIANVCIDIFNQFSPKFIYAFSDEISILLDEIPFSARVEKINSVFSSIASSSFTYHLLNDYSSEFNLDKLSDNDRNIVFPISFDSRIIPIDDESIAKYFKWRQDEAWRNCINGYGIWALKKEYGTKEANEKIKGLNSNEIHDLLFERGINLNDIDTWKKRGIGIYKKSWEIEGFNPVKGEKTVSTRSEVYVDYELEIFNREFFNNLK